MRPLDLVGALNTQRIHELKMGRPGLRAINVKISVAFSVNSGGSFLLCSLVKVIVCHGTQVLGLGQVVDGHVGHLEEILHDVMVLLQEFLHFCDERVGIFLRLTHFVP